MDIWMEEVMEELNYRYRSSLGVDIWMEEVMEELN